MSDPITPIPDGRTAVVIIRDTDGWTITGFVDGVLVETAKPLPASLAEAYLRAWLPDLAGGAR